MANFLQVPPKGRNTVLDIPIDKGDISVVEMCCFNEQSRSQGLSRLPSLSLPNDKGGRGERPWERGCSLSNIITLMLELYHSKRVGNGRTKLIIPVVQQYHSKGV